MKNLDYLIELAREVEYIRSFNNAIITIDYNCRNWHIFIGNKMYEVPNNEVNYSHVNNIANILNKHNFPLQKIYIVDGDELGTIQSQLMKKLKDYMFVVEAMNKCE